MKKNTAAVFCMGLALLGGIVCGVSAYLAPHLPLIWQISGGAALVLFIGYLALDYRSFGQIFSKRTTRYGLSAVVMILIAAGITIFLNLIANKHDLKKDFTKNQLNSLSEQTISVLKGLKNEVVLKAFVDLRFKEQYNEIFERYAYYSKMFKPTYADLDKDPQLMRDYKIGQGGALIFETGGRTERVDNLMPPDDDPKLEEKITNAIIRVTRTGKKKVYFVNGHGERSLVDKEPSGLSSVKESLEGSGYETGELTLAQTDKIPADANIVVIDGPKSDFLDQELKLLEAYLWNGGHLFVGVDPDGAPNLKGFLAKFGVDWKSKRVILETNPQQARVGTPIIPIVMTFDPSHQVSKKMRGMTIHEIASPVEKMANVPEGLRVTTLLSTSPVSFEAEFAKQIKANTKTDRKGPLGVMVAVEGPAKTAEAAKPAEPPKPGEEKKDEPKKPELRLVVSGDSDFLANSYVRFGLNSDLFQNTISWLAEEEDMITIRPKPKDERQFEVTELRAKVIRMASLGFLPLWFIVLGIVVYRSRHNK